MVIFRLSLSKAIISLYGSIQIPFYLCNQVYQIEVLRHDGWDPHECSLPESFKFRRDRMMSHVVDCLTNLTRTGLLLFASNLPYLWQASISEFERVFCSLFWRKVRTLAKVSVSFSLNSSSSPYVRTLLRRVYCSSALFFSSSDLSFSSRSFSLSPNLSFSCLRPLTFPLRLFRLGPKYCF